MPTNSQGLDLNRAKPQLPLLPPIAACPLGPISGHGVGATGELVILPHLTLGGKKCWRLDTVSGGQLAVPASNPTACVCLVFLMCVRIGKVIDVRGT